MKFLLDVHISTAIARALLDNGHDVVRAALIYPTKEDWELLEIAAEEQRILVTEDSDFTDLIFAEDRLPPPALIYIRCPAEAQPGMADRVLHALNSPELLGHLVLLTPTAIRHRPFPNADNDNA